MPTLYHSLGVGAQSLFASRQGVDTTGHNIANAQTEGYSRQRVEVTQQDPLQRRGLVIGNGVYVGKISRAHDSFNEEQLNLAQQDGGYARARSDALSSIELMFSPEQSAAVADQMTEFFNQMQSLADFPEDFTVRTSVIESAKNLTSSFRNVAQGLKDQRRNIDQQVEMKATHLSDLLENIAKLNVKIRTMEVGFSGQQANDLRDQRDLLLREISGVMDVNYYEDQYGMLMVRGPKQVTLVDGGNAAKLGVVKNSENGHMNDIVAIDWEQGSSKKISDAITTGELRGLLEVRDEIIPNLTEKNNRMAFALANNFNQAHREGFGLKQFSETSGRNFFRQPMNLKTAAESLYLDDAILQSHDAISVASSPLAPGDNVVANKLVGMKDAKFMEDSNVTMVEYYANYVGALGLEIVRSNQLKEANDILVADLETRRESIAGVSLDEEAMNLLKWQSSFTASSKIITTVDEMLETVLSLKR